MDQCTVIDDSMIEDDTPDAFQKVCGQSDEDNLEAMQAAQRANFMLIMHGALVVGVCALDAMAFLVLHVLLPEVDFMCDLREDKSIPGFVFVGYNGQRVVLIAFVILLYSFLLVSLMWDVAIWVVLVQRL